ncbi:hypothetical protein S40285_08332 [Stachybotrys chlorohalonatus IBT 40285]|uniref:Uncharacterized protein n=1 Tax=Stachybotrys chlorohalonatus (strain IBT 40285) TaxID=1283841 RepID=A0A084QM70_STAC4|nr:hypothetical protein S40285_08332 [Stachybotrys chlorohalonata IBT 40285]
MFGIVQTLAVGIASSLTMDSISWISHGSTSIQLPCPRKGPSITTDANLVSMGQHGICALGPFLLAARPIILLWTSRRLPSPQALRIPSASAFYLFFSKGKHCGYYLDMPAHGKECQINVPFCF